MDSVDTQGGNVTRAAAPDGAHAGAGARPGKVAVATTSEPHCVDGKRSTTRAQTLVRMPDAPSSSSSGSGAPQVRKATAKSSTPPIGAASIPVDASQPSAPSSSGSTRASVSKGATAFVPEDRGHPVSAAPQGGMASAATQNEPSTPTPQPLRQIPAGADPTLMPGAAQGAGIAPPGGPTPSPRGKGGGAPTKTQAFAQSNIAVADNARARAKNDHERWWRKDVIKERDAELQNARDANRTYESANDKSKVPAVTAKDRDILENSGAHEQETRGLTAELAAETARKEKLDAERAQLKAKRIAQLHDMTPRERERAKKEEERLLRDRKRSEKLANAAAKRAKRRASRPGYKAREKARARRARNKAAKRLRKAKKKLAAARNKNLTKKARKKSLAKGKKALREAKAALAEKKRKDADPPTKAAEAENEELQKDIDAMEREVQAAEQDLADPTEEEAPAVGPCSLPCECNIPCEPPNWCICWRESVDEGEEPDGNPNGESDEEEANTGESGTGTGGDDESGGHTGPAVPSPPGNGLGGPRLSETRTVSIDTPVVPQGVEDEAPKKTMELHRVRKIPPPPKPGRSSRPHKDGYLHVQNCALLFRELDRLNSLRIQRKATWEEMEGVMLAFVKHVKPKGVSNLQYALDTRGRGRISVRLLYAALLKWCKLARESQTVAGITGRSPEPPSGGSSDEKEAGGDSGGSIRDTVSWADCIRRTREIYRGPADGDWNRPGAFEEYIVGPKAKLIEWALGEGILARSELTQVIRRTRTGADGRDDPEISDQDLRDASDAQIAAWAARAMGRTDLQGTILGRCYDLAGIDQAYALTDKFLNPKYRGKPFANSVGTGFKGYFYRYPPRQRSRWDEFWDEVAEEVLKQTLLFLATRGLSHSLRVGANLAKTSRAIRAGEAVVQVGTRLRGAQRLAAIESKAVRAFEAALIGLNSEKARSRAKTAMEWKGKFEKGLARFRAFKREVEKLGAQAGHDERPTSQPDGTSTSEPDK